CPYYQRLEPTLLTLLNRAEHTDKTTRVKTGRLIAAPDWPNPATWQPALVYSHLTGQPLTVFVDASVHPSTSAIVDSIGDFLAAKQLAPNVEVLHASVGAQDLWRLFRGASGLVVSGETTAEALPIQIARNMQVPILF